MERSLPIGTNEVLTSKTVLARCTDCGWRRVGEAQIIDALGHIDSSGIAEACKIHHITANKLGIFPGPHRMFNLYSRNQAAGFVVVSQAAVNGISHVTNF